LGIRFAAALAGRRLAFATAFFFGFARAAAGARFATRLGFDLAFFAGFALRGLAVGTTATSAAAILK
jgi:hypothetical protein